MLYTGSAQSTLTAGLSGGRQAACGREEPLYRRRGRTYQMTTVPSSSEPLNPLEYLKSPKSSEDCIADDMPVGAPPSMMNEQADTPDTSDTPAGRFFGQRGQSLFEYALIILFVALAVVVGLALIAPALNNIFHQVPNAF